jgi:hypothetical protein
VCVIYTEIDRERETSKTQGDCGSYDSGLALRKLANGNKVFTMLAVGPASQLGTVRIIKGDGFVFLVARPVTIFYRLLLN